MSEPLHSYVIGLLYPGFGAEDDYPALEKRLDAKIRLPLQHTSVGVDLHAVAALLDLGSSTRLAVGARELIERAESTGQPLDALMWACTSGSFVFGWQGAERQVAELAELIGLPTSSTSIAFVNAVRALGLTRVAVAASYPHDVAELFVEFLRRGGIEVTAMQSHGILTAAEVGLLGRDAVIDLVASIDADGAEAILVPDTAMHSLRWLDDLELAAGKPVLTANQVTVWEGLRLLGTVPQLDGVGSVFRTSVQVS